MRDEMVTDEQIANRFWEAMEEIYGKAWVKQFGDKPTQIWTRKLYELGVEKITIGIDELIYNNHKFPPSLPEFIRACKKVTPKYHSNVVALTEKRTPEQKNNGLKNIKNIIQTLEKGG
jgi:hypothetical protein